MLSRREYWLKRRHKMHDGYTLLIAFLNGLEVTYDEAQWAIGTLRGILDSTEAIIHDELNREENK